MQAWLIAEDFAYHTATWKIVAGSTPLAMSMVKALWRMKFPHTARCKKWEFPLSLQKGWQILLQVFIPYTQLGFPSLGTALQAQTTLRSLSCRSRTHIPLLSWCFRLENSMGLSWVRAPPQPCLWPCGSRQEEVSQGGLPSHLYSLRCRSHLGRSVFTAQFLKHSFSSWIGSSNWNQIHQLFAHLCYKLKPRGKV